MQIITPPFPTVESVCNQFAEFKRLERDHAKEKQKLAKDKDAGALNICLSVR
jgi:AmiR/NasT family two-component response regulator